MKFDLNKHFKLANGSEDKGDTIALAVAGILSQATGIPGSYQLKFWQWSVALGEAAILDIDEGDRQYICKYIEDNKNFPVGLQAQIREALDKDAAVD